MINLSLILNDVAKFVTSKVEISNIDESNYVSTENMLPNKGGVDLATSLPDTKSVREYLPNDILINNIRPYFKKIWFADKEGGCSNDVFVLRANDNYDSKFLYYVLSSDDFFSYVMANAKGTKMPRGDKKAIQNYSVPDFSIEDQMKISQFLSKIDEKIVINKKINHNLEQYLKLYFNEYFLEYDFNEFSNSNKPIPDSWMLGNFNEIINTLGSGDWGKDELIDNYTSEVYCIRGADIPDVKLGNKGKMPIRFILPKNFENKKLDENSIVIEISGGSPTQSTGRTVFITKDFLNRFDKDIICTNFCKVIKPKDNYEIFLYLYLNYLYDKDVMFAYENGTTGIKNFDIKSFINNFLIVIPSEADIIKFNNSVKYIFDIIMHNGLEMEKLAKLRDTLLPKLMSGEIDVSEVNCDLV